ncbi:MAG TPA: MIP/aquaporin family protein [Pirellulales bacterium]|jgi:glycerol uptake facilitator protein|nr:MIP/aquaporin family protein [Pirellulales bacterium]
MSDTSAEDQPISAQPPMIGAMLGEAFGTFLLVLLGCGAVHTAVLLEAQHGLWEVAIVWGVAIMLAIYTVDAISGAHINPAMTIAFAAWGRHPWRRVLPYVAAQLVGAILAAGVLYTLFSGFLAAKEFEKGVVRGEPGSIVTAMCYGEYFPNPGSLATSDGPYDAQVHAALNSRFGHNAAWLAEFLGTAVLAAVIFSLTDPRNSARPLANLAPVFIGLTVSALISVLAPLTQACFNPARDFGPRLFAYFAGWGPIAIPGLPDLGWLTVYILAPILGAVAGGGFYHGVLRPAQPAIVRL